MARECVVSKYISYSALYPRQQPWFKSDNPLLCVATSWTNQVGYIYLQHGSHGVRRGQGRGYRKFSQCSVCTQIR